MASFVLQPFVDFVNMCNSSQWYLNNHSIMVLFLFFLVRSTLLFRKKKREEKYFDNS